MSSLRRRTHRSDLLRRLVAGAATALALAGGFGLLEAGGPHGSAGAVSLGDVGHVAAAAATSTAGDPLSGASFYSPALPPIYNAVNAARVAGEKTVTSELQAIQEHENAIWLGSGTRPLTQVVNGYLTDATAKGQVPIFVLYALPSLDCRGYNSGYGMPTDSSYEAWVQSIANTVQGRRAVFIVEPDGVANSSCLPPSAQQDRMNTIRAAVQTLVSTGPNTTVYIDGGHENESVATMAKLLTEAGVGVAQGFSVNVSNFYSTATEEAYGNALSAQLGGKHYVIDTSRNGNGPAPQQQWCNPPGRALGTFATSETGNPLVDAFLWIKIPGESDGSCVPGAPVSGGFWTSYAVGLVTGNS